MIEGKKINLRLVQEEDLKEIVRLACVYAEMAEETGTRFFTMSQLKKKFDEYSCWGEADGVMVITDKENSMLGFISYFRGTLYMRGYEIGYGLYRREDRGKGYMTEALRLFSAYIFETMPVERLQVCTNTSNQASRRVAEKCGYRHEGTLRHLLFLRGQYHNGEMFSLLRGECPPLLQLLKKE